MGAPVPATGNIFIGICAPHVFVAVIVGGRASGMPLQSLKRVITTLYWLGAIHSYVIVPPVLCDALLVCTANVATSTINNFNKVFFIFVMLG